MLRQPAEQLSFDSSWSAATAEPSLRGARVLFLVDEITAITDGGTERQILQMIDICNQSGMHPQICVFRGTKWLTPQLACCPVTHFQIGRIASLHGVLSLIQLRRWMAAQKIDILQTFFSDANLIGPCLGRLAGIPIILGTRRNLNHASTDGLSRFQSRLQAFANRLTTHILANSQAVLERTIESEHISRKSISIVYNGIDLSQMRPAPEQRVSTRRALGVKNDQILVGNVSGLRAIKGVQLFVDAAAEAYRRDPRLRFLIVGDGELKAQLEEAIRNYELENIIRLNGAAEDVRPYLAAFDMAVLCSHAEGFSNSLLEYMACGVPVIATDVGGNREALGSCGLLIRPDVQELAGAIQAMTKPQMRSSFGAAALIKVMEFDLAVARERVTEIYAHYLTDAASRKRRPVPNFAAHTLPRSSKAGEA
jgi:L-malate glycosyltransferase